MGEIADMMLDGTLCSSCGEFLDSDGGYPMQCPACAGDGGSEYHEFSLPSSRSRRIWGEDELKSFEKYLKSLGGQSYQVKGDYEVLRMRGKTGRVVIVHVNKKGWIRVAKTDTDLLHAFRKSVEERS